MSFKPVWSTPGEVYHEICLGKSLNLQHHDAQFCGQWEQKPWLIIKVSHCRQRQIGNGALYAHQLNIIWLVNHRLPRYGVTHIGSHAAGYSCSVRFHLPLLNLCPGSDFRWLQLQRRGGLTGVCVAAVSQLMEHCTKRLSFRSIPIQSHLVQVLVEPWLAVVERWGRW